VAASLRQPAASLQAGSADHRRSPPITLLLSLACLVGLLPGRPVAAAQQDTDVARLERAALAELQDARTPGAAVALIRDGKVWIVLDPNGRDQYLYRGTRALSRLQ
jgi:CubicO group peptidase (beta-lactamase class C family)